MSKDGFELGKIRSFFWPIHRHELIKFLPMLLLFFSISINYHILRIAKDTLIITAPQSGAEAIPFLKVWAMLPTAIFMTFLFTKFANRFNKETLFYATTIVFLVFFLLFILFLYPYRESLYLHKFADRLKTILPIGFKGLIAMIRYWLLSLFYVMAESWSNIMLSLLLWGFANDVVKVEEAKRFYALFGIGINSSGILAGELGSYLSTHINPGVTHSIHPIVTFLGGTTSWDEVFMLYTGIIIVNCFIVMGLHKWLHLKVFTERSKTFTSPDVLLKKKKKMSLRKSILYVTKSKYLLMIAVIVLAYNVVINLTEVLWKSQLRELFPNPADFANYTSKITFYTGILATVASYFVSGNVIRKLGWKYAALITPLLITFTGIGFFYFLFLKEYSSGSDIIPILGMTTLTVTVFFGSMQNILSRSAKYTVFDGTKELAFIPLTSESKFKGKSAIDGLGSRLGKSGSSLLMQILLIFFVTPIASSPYILIIILFTVPLWIKAIGSLSHQFNEITEKAAPIPEKKEEAVSQTSTASS